MFSRWLKRSSADENCIADGRCAIDVDILTAGVRSEEASQAAVLAAAQMLLSICVQRNYRGGFKYIGELLFLVDDSRIRKWG